MTKASTARVVSNIELGTRTVDNPNWSRDHIEAKGNPRFITATINVRESAITILAAKKLLDEAQVRAADKFRALWETMGGAGAGAIDYSREYVDGGKGPQTITERQLLAGQELARCRKLLGLRGFTLIRAVCGEGQSLWDIGSKRRDRDTAADNLRACLDDLANMWGFQTKR